MKITFYFLQEALYVDILTKMKEDTQLHSQGIHRLIQVGKEQEEMYLFVRIDDVYDSNNKYRAAARYF